MDRTTKFVPIFFNHGGLVAGRGFVAHVAIQGRALIECLEEDLVAVYGVNPGGVAGQGSTLSEARRDFLEAVREVVFDLAYSSRDFESFGGAVRSFVADQNRRFFNFWLDSVRAIRDGAVHGVDFARSLPAETEASVEVSQVAPSAKDSFHGDHTPMLEPALNEQQDLLAACA